MLRFVGHDSQPVEAQLGASCDRMIVGNGPLAAESFSDLVQGVHRVEHTEGRI
jgi:hypothetical protein